MTLHLSVEVSDGERKTLVEIGKEGLSATDYRLCRDSFRRFILWVSVSGNSSVNTKTAGTMNSGSRSARVTRRLSGVGEVPGSGTT